MKPTREKLWMTRFLLLSKLLGLWRRLLE